MTEKEKMLAGKDYFPSDSELMELHKSVLRLIEEYNRNFFSSCFDGGELLQRILPNASDTLVIQPPFLCDFGINIYGGKNGFINYNCTILDTARITLGKNILIGPNVQIYAPMHPIDYRLRATGVEHGEPISIGDDCWIGGGAVICPGVTIGNRCIIGAGSVVSKDIPDDSMAVGIPARVIKKLI
ncbi:sugar O-acetyltransferase [Coprobacter tertius]|uniref:Sugar O-acetyltransferase n=1 Tax=Coprobacter tertius TaxID=2944915 RepID=A0ABT1MJM0_9BACT|nr:sugar O-acetyltransferase [Coprobacter tertius]MCP9612805.1 sugar O-acetyltransferase [Coprobacter tertius]